MEVTANPVVNKAEAGAVVRVVSVDMVEARMVVTMTRADLQVAEVDHPDAVIPVHQVVETPAHQAAEIPAGVQVLEDLLQLPVVVEIVAQKVVVLHHLLENRGPKETVQKVRAHQKDKITHLNSSLMISRVF